jgi:hypothetical protein
MLWVTWRQHRAELATGVLLLLAVAVPIVLNGLAVREAYQADGVAACVGDPSRTGCAEIVERFTDDHGEWGQRLLWFAFLPAVVGIFVGAPMLAREFEHGTWKLAFTQSVGRARWLVVKLAVVGASAAAFAAVVGLLLTWWREPLDAIGGRLRTSAFTIAAPSLSAVTLFAFATGVLAGALLRRTIAAMAVTLVAFGAVRLSVEEYFRTHYLRPKVRVTDAVTTPEVGWRPVTEWVVDSGWIDRAGRRLSEAEERAIIRDVYAGGEAVYGAGTPMERYLADHGLRHYAEYHPTGAFWTFQLIESALFLALAAGLLIVAVHVVRRRTT